VGLFFDSTELLDAAYLDSSVTLIAVLGSKISFCSRGEGVTLLPTLLFFCEPIACGWIETPRLTIVVAVASSRRSVIRNEFELSDVSTPFGVHDHVPYIILYFGVPQQSRIAFDGVARPHPDGFVVSRGMDVELHSVRFPHELM
jgi:hypothetical protein